MKIIYELGGKVYVVNPNPNSELTLEQIAAKDVPSGVDYKIVDDSAIPVSREHRDEWKINGNTIEIDQAKVDAKLAAKSEKTNKRNAILSKLKITEDELKDLLG